MTTIARREFMALAAATLGAASAEARGSEIPLGRGFQLEPGGQYFMPTHFGARLPGKASARYLDVTSMAVSYLTDPERLARCLPAPFEVTEEPRITVFFPGGVSYATVVPTTMKPAEAWPAKGEVRWCQLTREQNPTQAHIVEALRQLPVLKYVSATVTRGAIDLSAPGRSVRSLH